MNKQGPIKQLLLASSYWALSKPLVYALDLETAFLLCNFAEAENLSNDGWFYQTIATVEEKTTLSRRKQDRAISKLEKLGILESDVRGIPAKRYFRINYDKVGEILFGYNGQHSLSETSKLDSAKRATNKELNNKELIINNNSQAKARQEISYKEIMEYLNSKADRRFNYNSNSNRKLIKARYNEGYKKEDFIKVIDTKVKEWKNTDMERYIRPVTLFGNKFDDYLNQDKINKDKTDPYAGW